MKKLPGEFELIARLCKRLAGSRRTILGPGDDCAIIARPPGAQLVTIDSMVERVHFNLGWGTPRLLGRRALAVNLSDVAAMGGTPTACVVNLAIRPGLDARFFDQLYAGLRSTAAAARVDVIGGNITRARELSITICLLGDAPRAPLRRDLARPGDSIFVTGTLGDAAAGWRIRAGEIAAQGAARAFLVRRYLDPTPRLVAGQRLARSYSRAAAIDISDGLLQDLGHILDRSGAGAELDLEAIPLSAAYRRTLGGDLGLALSGGEDYELLFCARAGADAAPPPLGVPAHRIGRIVAGDGIVLRRDGRRTTAPAGPPGWDQLRARG